jgi:hypothetical protein
MKNIICEHGGLARKCELCERNERISELELVIKKQDEELKTIISLLGKTKKTLLNND